MSGKFKGSIRVCITATAFFVNWMAGVPATATPLAGTYFGPTDFEASVEVVVQTAQGSPVSSENRGTGATASLAREEGVGPLGTRGYVRAMAGGSAGLGLHAVGATEVDGRAGPDAGEQLLAYGESRAGVVNKFLAVPKSGFLGTEARFVFEVRVTGLLFADLFNEELASFPSSGSAVTAGIGFVVPGCPGCIGDYLFEDRLSIGDASRSVADSMMIDGVIPVGVPITVEAGLSIWTQLLATVSPDGSFWGNSGAFFDGTLRFGVSSPDEVDFVWASDLFYDRQPSVSDPVQIPEPSSLVLVGGLLAVLGVRRAAQTRLGRAHATPDVGPPALHAARVSGG